jgi:hypothetical protein
MEAAVGFLLMLAVFIGFVYLITGRSLAFYIVLFFLGLLAVFVVGSILILGINVLPLG